MSENNQLARLAEEPAVVELSQKYGLAGVAFLHTMRTVAMPKDHSMSELISCLMVAKEHGLNPLTKEVYFMRTRAGQIQPIIAIDGWIRKANEHPQYDGCEFETIRNEKGDMVAMKCKIFRKDRNHPIAIEEDLAECKKGGGKVWETHPHRMMRNRTFSQCARLAFGFAGVMEAGEFQDWQQNPALNPVDITPPVDRYEDAVVSEAPDCRDGGPLPSKRGGRPSANAYKEAGSIPDWEVMRDEIMAAESVSELYSIYDKHQRDGQPWFGLPWGYARIVQDEYYSHALGVLQENAPDSIEEIIDPETGEITDGAAEPVKNDVILRAVKAAETMDQLNALWQSLSEEDRDACADAYMDRLEEIA